MKKNQVTSTMRTLALTLALGATVTMTSCRKDHETPAPNDPEVRFTASIDDYSAKTRTVQNGDLVSWTVGDKVGIYMLNAGSTTFSGAHYSNIPYKISDPAGKLNVDTQEGRAIKYPMSGNVDFISYYPYNKTGKIDAQGIYTVSLTDQSFPENLDVLTAKKAGVSSTSTTPVNLNFFHALSKITVNLKAESGMSSSDISKIQNSSAVKLNGTPASVSIDLKKASATAAATISSNAANGAITLKKIDHSGSNDASFSAIIAPTPKGTARTLTITINGRDIEWSIPDTDVFTPGKHIVYTGTISGNIFYANSSQIANWDNSTGGTLYVPCPAGEVIYGNAIWAKSDVISPGTFAADATTSKWFGAEASSVCPTGWRLPNAKECYNLFGGSSEMSGREYTFTYSSDTGLVFGTVSGPAYEMSSFVSSGLTFQTKLGYYSGWDNDTRSGTASYWYEGGIWNVSGINQHWTENGNTYTPYSNVSGTGNKGSVRCVRNL